MPQPARGLGRCDRHTEANGDALADWEIWSGSSGTPLCLDLRSPGQCAWTLASVCSLWAVHAEPMLVLSLQDDKRAVAQAALGADGSIRQTRLSLDELRKLFGLSSRRAA